jgi:ankyrin repeat protein
VRITVPALLVVVLLAASCQRGAETMSTSSTPQHHPQSPQAARRTLEQQGIPYTESAFVEQARNGNVRAVALFLAAGMSPNATDQFGQSALFAAGVTGHAEVMHLLLDKGASLATEQGVFLLHQAAGKGHTQVIHLLLAKGIDVNAQDTVGYTALMRAAEAGQDDTLMLLIAKGAEVNAQEMHGYSSLMWAVMKGKKETARLLAEHQADVNAREKKANWTALMMATVKDDVEMVRLLLDKGADPKLADTSGTTALEIARRRRNPLLIQLLEHAQARSSG